LLNGYILGSLFAEEMAEVTVEIFQEIVHLQDVIGGYPAISAEPGKLCFREVGDYLRRFTLPDHNSHQTLTLAARAIYTQKPDIIPVAQYIYVAWLIVFVAHATLHTGQ
jgi:hypothetical protein